MNTTQQPDPNDLSVILSAVSVPNVFDDDRDAILAKFNKVQAFLGVGQGYFNKNAQPINFSMENPFCKFKVENMLFLLIRCPFINENHREDVIRK